MFVGNLRPRIVVFPQIVVAEPRNNSMARLVIGDRFLRDLHSVRASFSERVRARVTAVQRRRASKAGVEIGVPRQVRKYAFRTSTVMFALPPGADIQSGPPHFCL